MSCCGKSISTTVRTLPDAVTNIHTGAHAWAVLRGAAKCARRVVRGEVEPQSTIDKRSALCRDCDSLTPSEQRGRTGYYCGVPLEETETTCGCLVGVKTQHDAFVPACKLLIKGQVCPQEKW